MKKIFLYVIAAGLMLLNSCKKDDLTGPEIQTLSVIAVSPTTVTFTGNILSKGKQRILDYGFVYGPSSNIDENTGTKISLGSNAGSGQYSRTIDSLKLGIPYGYSPVVYARAYIRDERGVAFGALLNANLPIPSSSGISPNTGKSGDIVKISGKFFSPVLKDVRVNFAGTDATVVAATDSEISVAVPSGINARHGNQINVVVSIGSSSVQVSSYFTILANIKDFSPKSGPIGSYVAFTGDNLPGDYYYGGNIAVSFNETTATITYNSLLQTIVPSNIKDKAIVSVTINGQKTVLPGEFTIVPPEITSFSPESGLPGSVVNVNIANFAVNYYDGYPQLKLGDGDYQSANSTTASGFSYVIPYNTEDGDYTLSMKFGSSVITAPKKLKVLAYEVTGFSPQEGAPGREINISGRFIKDAGYNVYFGTVGVWATATSATSIKVLVPTGVNAGKVKISVDVPGKKIVSPDEFEVKGPSVTSFSPASAIAGTILTIKGTGFYPGDYYTTVKFGTIATSVISVTENTITVAVPSNLNLGAMKLTIVSGGQTIVADANFTATN
jgi:hypothetical protein